MTAPNDLLLAELLCARLCHDLSGPVGAAAAGAELLDELGEAGIDGDTLGLVATSAAAAAARLKFFRAAFGPGGRDQATAPLRELIEGYLASSQSAAAPDVSLDWRVATAELPATTARLLLNLVLIARDALPRGGAITVEMAGACGTVTARGTPASLTEEAHSVLVEAGAADGPRGGQALLARRLARLISKRFDIGINPDAVTLAFGDSQR